MANEQRNNGSSSNSPYKNKSIGSSSNASNSVKPKQPQRGLGVAQLEKIRLEAQMATYGYISPYDPAFQSTLLPTSQRYQDELRRQTAFNQATLLASPAGPAPFCYGPPPVFPYGYNYPNNFTMGTGEHTERTGGIRINEPQPYMTTTARWNPNNNVGMLENPYSMQDDAMVTKPLLGNVEEKNRWGKFLEGSSSHNADSSDENDEELDLELKL